MSSARKALIVVALGVAVVAVVLVKQADKHQALPSGPAGATKPASSTAASAPHSHPAAASAPASGPAEQTGPLPRLVDLGSVNCIPCKRMAPILAQLAVDFQGRLNVDFYDVMAEPDIGRSFGIRLIPTQIFFDAAGRELARHEGFMSREDILGKWKELGLDLQAPAR